MIIDTIEEVVMDTDVTSVFFQKMEIIFVLMIFIFIILCVLLIFSTIM